MSTSGSLPTQVSPSSSLPSVPSPVPNVTSSISGSIPVGLSSTPNLSSSVSTPAPTDVHSQMMLLMAESFSKLSSVLTEKNTDSKSDWPKFAGDIKKFRTWYLAILAQVSLPPWAELYDPVRNDILSSTSNSTLNGKLYSKLLLALEGTALQNMISRKHLRANGLLLLHELVQTYRPTNVPEVIAAKTSEFWGHTKRSSHETVDQYYNRFHDLLDDLQDAEETISTKSAIRHFIFTLGVEFEAIQNNFRIGNLPAAWMTDDWPTILVLCRNYFNSVKPQGISRKDTTSDNNIDMIAHKKKIRDWFMNPTKFHKHIEAEQQKHSASAFSISPSHIKLMTAQLRRNVINFSLIKSLMSLLHLHLLLEN